MHQPFSIGDSVLYQDETYIVSEVDGNVLELRYHTGRFFRFVHVTSVEPVCPPSPVNAVGQHDGSPAARERAGIRLVPLRRDVLSREFWAQRNLSL